MISPFSPADHPAIIKLLRLNTPRYFHADEEEYLLRYLHHEATHYFVHEENGQLTAAAGTNFGFNDGKTARLSWDLVHPRWQGKGIGRQLLQFRLRHIARDFLVERVEVRTSQMAYLFYRKSGFTLIEIKENYWSPGFDLYHMYMERGPNGFGFTGRSDFTSGT